VNLSVEAKGLEKIQWNLLVFHIKTSLPTTQAVVFILVYFLVPSGPILFHAVVVVVVACAPQVSSPK
jgi:hypothetical protein